MKMSTFCSLDFHAKVNRLRQVNFECFYISITSKLASAIATGMVCGVRGIAW